MVTVASAPSSGEICVLNPRRRRIDVASPNGTGAPSMASSRAERSATTRSRGGVFELVDRAGNGRSVRQIDDERRRVRQHVGRVAAVDSALEAVARFGVQTVAPRRAAHAARREVSALDEDPLGRSARSRCPRLP